MTALTGRTQDGIRPPRLRSHQDLQCGSHPHRTFPTTAKSPTSPLPRGRSAPGAEVGTQAENQTEGSQTDRKAARSCPRGPQQLTLIISGKAFGWGASTAGREASRCHAWPFANGSRQRRRARVVHGMGRNGSEVLPDSCPPRRVMFRRSRSGADGRNGRRPDRLVSENKTHSSLDDDPFVTRCQWCRWRSRSPSDSTGSRLGDGLRNGLRERFAVIAGRQDG